MPVILKGDNIAKWLEPEAGQTDLLDMLEPYPDGLMEAYPVSSKVNNPRNNGPECVAKSTSTYFNSTDISTYLSCASPQNPKH